MPRIPNNEIDYTSRDYEGIRTSMIEALQLKMPEYTDLRQTDAGIVLLELLAQGLDVVNYYLDSIANEVFLPSEEQRDNVLKWCNMFGYVPQTASPSKFKQIFVLVSAQVTDTIIPAGTVVKTYETPTENSIYFETETALTIPAGALGDEVDGEGEYLYSVNVVQGITVSNELVGTSTGAANQQFTLKYGRVLPDSVSLRVNEGSGFSMWDQVPTLIDSSSLSQHFTVSLNDMDKATITFGDSVFGKIPSPFNKGIYCTYRVGGGTSGNVAANKITLLDQTIALVDRTFNPEVAYVFGEDKETMEEIKRNAPLSLKTQWGALSLEDFSAVILSNFPEVKYASAKVNETDVDAIDIYLLTKTSGTFASVSALISDFFSVDGGGRSIVGVDAVNIIEATITPLTLVASLIVHPTFSRATVSAQIQEFVTNYFAYGNYTFDTDLSFAELTMLIMTPDSGIRGIKSLNFTSPAQEVLTPSAGVIYSLDTLTLNTTGGVA